MPHLWLIPAEVTRLEQEGAGGSLFKSRKKRKGPLLQAEAPVPPPPSPTKNRYQRGLDNLAAAATKAGKKIFT